MKITYSLSFPEPHTHYLEVEMHLGAIQTQVLALKMAVWTPGSYLIREFQRNIDFVERIYADGRTERLEKTDKHSWKLDTQQESNIRLRYRVYCFEYTVRTNFIDEAHALLNGAPTFLYAAGYEDMPCDIHIQPHPSWKKISTALEMKDKDPWIRFAKNLDEIIDSPMEIGNHSSSYFEAEGVQHELAVYGESNGDMQKLVDDLKAVVREEVRIFGAHPCKNYLFILHHTDGIFGGLEHLHSSVNFVNRWAYEPKKYQQVISLLAHEYFHLWNVKRIRPATLGPFNYEKENYTTLLWFFEGITSYYDDYICYRAGVTSRQDYLDIVAKNINNVLNLAGTDTQTLVESSFDTWIKYYRKNENSNNVQISYYNQGSVAGMLFDLIIIDATQGNRSLDDVMRALYERYLSDPGTGISEETLLAIFNEVSGIDCSEYFNRFLRHTGIGDIEPFFEKTGIALKDNSPKDAVYLGMSTDWKEGRLIITELDKNYGAYQGGLNVNDELIAIDDHRVSKDFTKFYTHKAVNERVKVLISRQGTIKSYNIGLSPDIRKNYTLSLPGNIATRQTINLKKWLKWVDY